MKLAAFAIIVASICAGYGLSLILVPVKFLEPYRIMLNEYGVLMARGYRAALCQVGIIFWFSRNIPGSAKNLVHFTCCNTILYCSNDHYSDNGHRKRYCKWFRMDNCGLSGYSRTILRLFFTHRKKK
jgi:hypothetical protein